MARRGGAGPGGARGLHLSAQRIGVARSGRGLCGAFGAYGAEAGGSAGTEVSRVARRARGRAGGCGAGCHAAGGAVLRAEARGRSSAGG